MLSSGVLYDERLTAPRSWWSITVLAGISVGLALFPYGLLAVLGGLVVGTALAAVGVSAYGSARVRVIGDTLVAGEARVPVSALGETHVLDAEEARAWRTHRADPRAYMLLRSYIPTAVRIEVVDPEDPTPYLYLSTRRPRALADALEKARA